MRAQQPIPPPVDTAAPTRVCITVDTEFSMGGVAADARHQPVAEPMVWCDVDGRSEGLGFLLHQFARWSIPATFFVETSHRHHFPHDPMAPIARRIAAHGHEVQLHVHPCWSVFQHADWQARLRAQPRQDDFYGRSEDSSLALIEHGLAAFRAWRLAPPLAFRSGCLQHDAALYRALARAGVPYSSNVGLAIFNSGDPAYQLYSGRHERHGVAEFPVLTFKDWRVGQHQHHKSLTIAGSSFAETRYLLGQARRAGLAQVVILTHPFEYIQSRDLGRQRARRHGVNQRRLTALCQFLDCHRDRFQPCGLAEAARHDTAANSASNTLLEGKPWHSLRRMATQVAYDHYGRWALAARRGARP